MHRVTWTDEKEDENVKISKICQKKHHVQKKINAMQTCDAEICSRILQVMFQDILKSLLVLWFSYLKQIQVLSHISKRKLSFKIRKIFSLTFRWMFVQVHCILLDWLFWSKFQKRTKIWWYLNHINTLNVYINT